MSRISGIVAVDKRKWIEWSNLLQIYNLYLLLFHGTDLRIQFQILEWVLENLAHIRCTSEKAMK